MALAAAKLGLKTIIYGPDKDACASFVASKSIIADYDDEEALTDFANSVDIVTYEFENVPAQTASIVSALTPLHPNGKSLAICQDRLLEKQFLNKLNIPTTRFSSVTSSDELEQALKTIGTPSILKTRRLGYDGKGQTLITAPEMAAEAWQAVNKHEAVLEGFVEFEKEISIIGARNQAGKFNAYAPSENIHKNHILYKTIVPARIIEETAKQAEKVAKKISDALNYVGVFAVEFFVSPPSENGTNQLLVNEIAPRVHNSGHWTMDACLVSQFEQHIRAVCDWPLGTTTRHSDAIMTNILGPDTADWQEYANVPDTSLHLYDKGEAKAGRKMGHMTQTYPMGELPVQP